MKTVEAAKTARVPALVFSIFGAIIWSVIAISTVFGHKSIYGYSAFLSLVLYTAISFGLFKMRREAAVAYFVVSIVAVVFAWGHTAKLIPEIAGVFVALVSIRGTLSYARLCARDDQKPTSNQEDAPV